MTSKPHPTEAQVQRARAERLVLQLRQKPACRIRDDAETRYRGAARDDLNIWVYDLRYTHPRAAMARCLADLRNIRKYGNRYRGHSASVYRLDASVWRGRANAAGIKLP